MAYKSRLNNCSHKGKEDIYICLTVGYNLADQYLKIYYRSVDHKDKWNGMSQGK